MKRIGAFFLAFILAALSIFIYYPSLSFAADDVTVIPRSVKENFSFSSSDAQSYVEAHKDIYSNDNVCLFIYDPGDSYNWTLGSATSNGIIIHLSDNQLKNVLMTSNNISQNSILLQGLLSNSSINRSLLIGLGCLAGSSSDTTKAIIDTIYGNYNYLNSISYDETTQTITMDSSSVDALREEIKKYYYDSIGLMSVKPTDTIHNPGYLIELNRPLYDYEEDYISDFNSLNQYDYSVGTRYGDYTTRLICGFDKNSYSYAYIGSLGNKRAIYFLDKDMNSINDSVINVYTAQSYGVANERIDLNYTFKTFNLDGNVFGLHLFSQNDSGNYDESTFYNGFTYDRSVFFSKNGKPFTYFSSYEKLFNFLNGSQDAYLSSRIDKAGEDISFSINDMNENLGSKMDELIDSINSNKSGMSQDELQNAIDKGLEDLNKNAEEIKDNTEETNNKLDELIAAVNQGNDTLLEILGVTEYIAYSTTKDDGTAYTFDDLFFTFGSIYDALGNAILYGVNTLDADGAAASYSSSAYSSSAYSLSSAALLSDDDSGNSGSGGSFANSSSGNSGSGGSVGDSGSGNSGSGSHIDFEYRNGLFGHFPFSVPYQLYEWLQVLKATPKCPEFTYNYGFLIGHKDEEAYSITFDLSAYQDWADNCKSFLRLSFTLFFAVGVFKKLKGVM